MSGPSLAPILIPIVGTLSLVAWLLAVFHAGRPAAGTAETPRPAAEAVPAPRQPADASLGQRPAVTPGGRA